MREAGIDTEELEEVLRGLPPAAQKELWQFVAYLRHKHQVGRAVPPVPLGGLWADLPLDVTDEEVRALRQRVTSHSATRV